MKFFFYFQIFQSCQVCQQQPRLFQTHGAQIHTLLVSLNSSFCLNSIANEQDYSMKPKKRLQLSTLEIRGPPAKCVNYWIIYSYFMDNFFMYVYYIQIWPWFYPIYLYLFYLQGLYAMSMNCMEAAESQFKTALTVRW